MANNNAQALGFHSKIERNVTLLLVLSLLVVTVGGIVEIAPLFYLCLLYTSPSPRD